MAGSVQAIVKSFRGSLLGAAVLVAALAGPARASCAGVPPVRRAVREARTAFVGTVTETTNSGRWATVEVAEVWKGDAEPLVEVRGGPKDPPGPMNVASSTDRHFREGKTYLFLPQAVSERVFRDDICTATTGYREGLERFRPSEILLDDVRTGVADDGGFPVWAAGALAGAALAGFLLIRRLRGS
jgi:hypothetical protein